MMANLTSTHTLCELEIKVTIKSPWLVHGNDPGLFGLDAVHLRNHEHQKVLPGTLLAGRIREAWVDIGLGHELGDTWFGCATNGRARVFVDDLVQASAETPAPKAGLATRVRISDETGAGDDGMLQFIEQDDAPGSLTTLKGTWRAWLTNEEQTRLPLMLAQGLRWHSQLGALRNVGFGELCNVQIGILNNNAAALPPPADTVIGDQPEILLKTGLLGLSISFDQALAVGNKVVNGNVFESSDIVTGATIKGALATVLKSSNPSEPLPAWFERLRITHALPSANNKRPSPIPLNWCADTSGHLLAWQSQSVAMHGGQAWAFQPDWKDPAFNAAEVHRQWGATTKELRVRTAIENGQAKDNSLFAYQCVRAVQGTKWLAYISLPDATEKECQQIAALLGYNRLGPIGKTDAFGEVTLLKAAAHQWPSQPVNSASFTLLLQSDALLLAMTQLAQLPSGDSDALRTILQSNLQAMADKVCEGAGKGLSVDWYFASHALAGGEYLHKRHRTGQPYAPFVLTRAGSIFKITLATVELAQCVSAAWQKHGLPLPPSAVTEYGNTWECNPYIPQNGWGEVLINPEHGVNGLPASNVKEA